MKGRWPFLLTLDKITINGLSRHFSTRDHAFCAVYPNPWNSERYVLLVNDIPDTGFFNFGCFAPFWLPDYVIASRSGLVVEEAGYFDENWQITR